MRRRQFQGDERRCARPRHHRGVLDRGNGRDPGPSTTDGLAVDDDG